MLPPPRSDITGNTARVTRTADIKLKLRTCIHSSSFISANGDQTEPPTLLTNASTPPKLFTATSMSLSAASGVVLDSSSKKEFSENYIKAKSLLELFK